MRGEIQALAALQGSCRSRLQRVQNAWRSWWRTVRQPKWKLPNRRFHQWGLSPA